MYYYLYIQSSRAMRRIIFMLFAGVASIRSPAFFIINVDRPLFIHYTLIIIIHGGKRMDIDNLTYGELKQIAALFNRAENAQAKHNIGAYCIIRCDAGVHAGYLVDYNGREVVIKDSRRLWYWKCKDGHTLSGAAAHGVSSDSKIAAVVKGNLVLTEACEIIPCTETAKESIENAKEHNT